MYSSIFYNNNLLILLYNIYFIYTSLIMFQILFLKKKIIRNHKNFQKQYYNMHISVLIYEHSLAN